MIIIMPHSPSLGHVLHRSTEELMHISLFAEAFDGRRQKQEKNMWFQIYFHII